MDGIVAMWASCRYSHRGGTWGEGLNCNRSGHGGGAGVFGWTDVSTPNRPDWAASRGVRWAIFVKSPGEAIGKCYMEQ